MSSSMSFSPTSTMSMTLSSMSMAMSSTASAASATSSSMSMSGMGGDMGGDMGGNACKISMLWNWYTVDACFLARSWHVTSSGMFAGSCIGVIGLVIALEFLRRLGKEYDHFLLRDFQSRPAAVISTTPYVTGAGPTDAGDGNSSEGLNLIGARMAFNGPSRSFRPNLLQQAIRALLHMLQFAVAYFIMLLAMYYNGYIIICIFIGAYIGYFIFGWETVSLDGPQEKVTVCCG